MNIFSKFCCLARSPVQIVQLLSEVNNQMLLFNQKLTEICQAINNQSTAINKRLDATLGQQQADFAMQRVQAEVLCSLLRTTSDKPSLVNPNKIQTPNLHAEIDSKEFRAAIGKNERETAALIDCLINELIPLNHHTFFWGDRLLTLDKSAGFLSDPVFLSAMESIRDSSTGENQYSSPHKISWRLHTLVWAAKVGLTLEGDFVECGVYKGDMAWVVSKATNFGSTSKRFYLYDTFEGFSNKYSSSNDFPDNPEIFDHANDIYSQDPHLFSNVCSRFHDCPNIKVIKGVVPDVLVEEAPDKIAFLHLDLNSPVAEIGALEILFSRLTPGAILVFDDYGWKLHNRLKEAEDKFMRKLGYEILELPTGQGVVIKR